MDVMIVKEKREAKIIKHAQQSVEWAKTKKTKNNMCVNDHYNKIYVNESGNLFEG